MVSTLEKTNVGSITQIIGPVVDVSFDTSNTELPKIYDSLEINKDDLFLIYFSQLLKYLIAITKK